MIIMVLFQKHAVHSKLDINVFTTPPNMFHNLDEMETKCDKLLLDILTFLVISINIFIYLIQTYDNM